MVGMGVREACSDYPSVEYCSQIERETRVRKEGTRGGWRGKWFKVKGRSEIGRVKEASNKAPVNAMQGLTHGKEGPRANKEAIAGPLSQIGRVS